MCVLKNIPEQRVLKIFLDYDYCFQTKEINSCIRTFRKFLQGLALKRMEIIYKTHMILKVLTLLSTSQKHFKAFGQSVFLHYLLLFLAMAYSENLSKVLLYFWLSEMVKSSSDCE